MSSAINKVRQILSSETGVGIGNIKNSPFFLGQPNLDIKTMSKRVYVESIDKRLLTEASTGDLRIEVNKIQAALGGVGLRGLFDKGGPLDPEDPTKLWAIDIIDDAYGTLDCIIKLKEEAVAGTLGEISMKIVKRIRSMARDESKVGQNTMKYWTWIGAYWHLKNAGSTTCTNVDFPPPGGPAAVTADALDVLVYWNSKIANPLDLGDGSSAGDDSVWGLVTLQNLAEVIVNAGGSAALKTITGPAAALTGMDGPSGSIIHFPDVNIRVGVELTNGYVNNYADIADAIISVLDMGGSKSNSYIGSDELQAVASMLASLEDGHGGKPFQIDDGAGGGINIIWQLNTDYPDMIDTVDKISDGDFGSWSWFAGGGAYKDGIQQIMDDIARILSKHRTASRKSHGSQVVSEHFLRIKLKHDSERLFIRKRRGPVEETIRDAVRGSLRPILKNNAKLLNENININIGPLKKSMAAPDLCIYEEEEEPAATTPKPTPGPKPKPKPVIPTGGTAPMPAPAVVTSCPGGPGWVPVSAGAKTGWLSHDLPGSASGVPMIVAKYVVGNGQTDRMLSMSVIQIEIRKGKVRNVREVQGSGLRDGLFTGVAGGIKREIKRKVKGEIPKDVAGTITVRICPS